MCQWFFPLNLSRPETSTTAENSTDSHLNSKHFAPFSTER